MWLKLFLGEQVIITTKIETPGPPVTYFINNIFIQIFNFSQITQKL